MKIHKYHVPIPVDPRTPVRLMLPQEAKPLSVGVQDVGHDTPLMAVFLWASHELKNEKILAPRDLYVVPTGVDVHMPLIVERLGRVDLVDAGLVFHVFSVLQ